MSEDRLAAHLFAHLNDAGQLRTNELVASLFPPDLDSVRERLALAKLRSIVETEIKALRAPGGRESASLARRRCEILQRCELDGEPHKTLALELGVTLRQFYRQLKRARIDLALAVAAAVQRECKPVPLSVVDVARAQLVRMRGLFHACKFEEASARGKQLLLMLPEGASRVDALLALGEIYADAGWRGALEHLLDGAQFAQNTEISPDVLTLSVRALRARVDYIAGHAQRALTVLSFDRIPRLETRRDYELFATVLVQSAQYASTVGEHTRATELTNLAYEVLARCDDTLVSAQRANLLLAQKDLSMEERRFDDAKIQIHEAYRIATAHALPRTAAEALLSSAMIRYLEGDADEALTLARSIIPMIDNLAVPENAWSYAMAGHLEVNTGNYDRALTLARKAQAFDGEPNVRNALAKTVEADSLLHLSRGTVARDASLRAVEEMRGFGVQRAIGLALRVAAEVEEQCGNVTAMREYIREAVEVLERFGHPSALARALECSARMTGNRKHARQARLIRAG